MRLWECRGSDRGRCLWMSRIQLLSLCFLWMRYSSKYLIRNPLQPNPSVWNEMKRSKRGVFFFWWVALHESFFSGILRAQVSKKTYFAKGWNWVEITSNFFFKLVRQFDIHRLCSFKLGFELLPPTCELLPCAEGHNGRTSIQWSLLFSLCFLKVVFSTFDYYSIM